MELEKTFFNNQFKFGYSLYKLKPIKPAESFFKEALEETIKTRGLKGKDKIQLIFLYEDINCCTDFCTVEDLDFDYMCDKKNFNCIDFNIHTCNKNEFKIEVKFVIL